MGMDAFEFDDDVPRSRQNTLVAWIPGTVEDEDALHEALSGAFEHDYGGDMDGLDEALAELAWLEEHRLVVAHEVLPALDADALARYVEVLHDAATAWAEDDEHALVVRFPESARRQVRELLR